MRVSSMSLIDYVKIVGHYNRIQHGPSIDPRIYERGYTPEQLKVMEDQQKAESGAISSLNIQFTAPIESFDYPLFGYIYTSYRYTEKGVLPFPGSLSDQPAQIMEIFNTLESLELENQQREFDRMKRENGRN